MYPPSHFVGAKGMLGKFGPVSLSPDLPLKWLSPREAPIYGSALRGPSVVEPGIVSALPEVATGNAGVCGRLAHRTAKKVNTRAARKIAGQVIVTRGTAPAS